MKYSLFYVVVLGLVGCSMDPPQRLGFREFEDRSQFIERLNHGLLEK